MKTSNEKPLKQKSALKSHPLHHLSHRKPQKLSKNYFVYIVECKDKSLYTGYTTDVVKRIHAHNYGKTGAKYTKARRPVVLKYIERFKNLSKALKREHALKKFSREEKTALILKSQNL